MTESVISYIGIGSNMGDREAFCAEAIHRIARFPKSSLISVSSLYETAPVELKDQDWFINCVAAIRTELSPLELFRACQEVEQSLGRKRTARYGPRTIDLDILFYGNRVIREPDLTVPHPKVHERRFALEPLAEIAPDLKHPILHKTAAEILKGLQDQEVRRLASVNLRQKAG